MPASREAEDGDRATLAAGCALQSPALHLVVLCDRSLLLPPAPALCPQGQDQQQPVARAPTATGHPELPPHRPHSTRNHGMDPGWHLCPSSLERPNRVCLSAALCSGLEIRMAEIIETKKINKTAYENTGNSMQTK